MLPILLVLAHVLNEFGVRIQFEPQRGRPRLTISNRVLKRELDIHLTQVFPLKTFDKAQLIAMRVSRRIEPALIVQAPRVDDQRVALPFAYGISKPCGIHFLRMATPIGENLPEARALFKQNQRDPGGVHDFESIQHHPLRDAMRKAVRGWHIAGEIPSAFAKNSFRPRCHRDWSSRITPSLEIETRQRRGRENHTGGNYRVEISVPDPAQVRFPVETTRGGS